MFAQYVVNLLDYLPIRIRTTLKTVRKLRYFLSFAFSSFLKAPLFLGLLFSL